MLTLSLNEKILIKEAPLTAFHVGPKGKKKFILPKQLDLISETLKEHNYLDFETLATVVLSVMRDYYEGKPAKADEGDSYAEWAFARNLYEMTRKLKALEVHLTEDRPEEKDAFHSAFEQLKQSYLLYRVDEIRDMLSLYMGRWGYSDLWSCLDRLSTQVASLHKQVSGKKINPAKRVRYFMNQLEAFEEKTKEAPFKYRFLSMFVEDYEALWSAEMKRMA